MTPEVQYVLFSKFFVVVLLMIKCSTEDVYYSLGDIEVVKINLFFSIRI